MTKQFFLNIRSCKCAAVYIIPVKVSNVCHLREKAINYEFDKKDNVAKNGIHICFFSGTLYLKQDETGVRDKVTGMNN